VNGHVHCLRSLVGRWKLFAILSPLLLTGCVTNRTPFAVLKSEFIYDAAPFPSCHASTIEQTGSGLVAAWFGGTDEGNSDVSIWVARDDGRGWSAPFKVADGVQADGKRWPCWNPVLYQAPDGPLCLYYKVGPKPSNWWGMVVYSPDGGKSWSKPERLPENIFGPIKNKPMLISGRLWCPSSSEDRGWRIHMEFTSDSGKSWSRTEALNDGKEFSAIQPTILAWKPDSVQLLCRSRQGRVTECWTTDGGQTFSPMRATSLQNPNSGIDAVMLRDGRALLVYNDTPRGRSPLNVAVSADGREWKNVVTLENQPGEYSYPAIIQTSDGLVHITYTWKREKIRHVVLKP